MESGLKQRLIGGAVLVALAVIFLPMLLDSPAPRRGVEDVRLDLPAPPARDFETRELPLGVPPAPPTSDDAAAAAVQREHLALVDTADGREGASTDPQAARADADIAIGAAATESADAEATTGKQPGQAAEASPTAGTGNDTTATDIAKPPAVVQPPPPGAADQQDRYLLRIGSFANLDNARALAKRLRAAGLVVREESISVDGKQALRLEAGPYAGPAAANQASQVARRIDASLKPQVLEPENTLPAVAGSGYAVQVGAFSKQEDANLLRERLRKGGYNAFIVAADTDAGRLFRVRVGPELDRARAETLATQLKDKFRLAGMIVNHP